MENINEFELHDFVADPNFDQFIDLIRGENEGYSVANFNCDLINVSDNFAENINYNSQHQFMMGPSSETNNDNNNNNVFGFDGTMMVSSDPNSVSFIGAFPDFDHGEIMMAGDDDDEENDGEDSSGTTTTTPTTSTKRPKVDRSRTLISERRRRGRMKEKLYALRSLVPNITKMDKASIVGDAVLYLQDLQMKAKKLKAEIASLEASLEEAERYQGSTQPSNKIKPAQVKDSVPKAIIQMGMFQVEERGFYVKVVCNKGEGATISLYKALESLTTFNLQSSNLATVSDRFVLTFTLNVKESEQEPINLPNLKLWVTGAFVNQGFELKTELYT